MLVKNLILAFYLVAVLTTTISMKKEGNNAWKSGIFLLVITFLGLIS